MQLLNRSKFWILLLVYNFIGFLMAYHTAKNFYSYEGFFFLFLSILTITCIVILIIFAMKLSNFIKLKKNKIIRKFIIPYGMLLFSSIYWLGANVWVIDSYYSDGWYYEWILVVAGKRNWQALFNERQIP